MPVLFFNGTARTEIYTLSLHDALPIFAWLRLLGRADGAWLGRQPHRTRVGGARSEEHTSELQSQSNLVCRLLLEKKKIILNRARDVCRPVKGITHRLLVSSREMNARRR